MLLLFSAFRALKLPGSYPLSHWLLSWEHGFIKRGLVGTVLLPLIQFKTRIEILHLIFALSMLIVFAVAALLLSLYRRSLKRLDANNNGSDAFLLQIATVVFASSAAVVIGTYNTGFLEHFLEVACLLSVTAVLKRRYLPVLLLTVVAMLIHEMYLVYGFPIVLLALLQQSSAQRGEGASRLQAFRLPFVAVVVALITAVFVIVGSTNSPPEQLEGLKSDIMDRSGLNAANADNAVFHLKHTFVQNFKMQIRIPGRFTDTNIAQTTYPATLFLLLAAGAILRRAGRLHRMWMVVPAVLAPMALHFAAWDTPRFSAFTTVHAVVALFVCAQGIETERPAASRSVIHLFILLALAVCAINMGTEIFWGRFPISQGSSGGIRTTPPIQWFDKCRPLFPNSKFESGGFDNWTSTGPSFVMNRAPAPTPHYDGGPVDIWYVSSRPSDDVSNHAPQRQELTSKEFRILEDRIIFMMGGTDVDDVPQGSVSLLVEGRSVLHTTTPATDREFRRYEWDVNAYRNKNAVIRIVDDRQEHSAAVIVDNFCYSPR